MSVFTVWITEAEEETLMTLHQSRNSVPYLYNMTAYIVQTEFTLKNKHWSGLDKLEYFGSHLFKVLGTKHTERHTRQDIELALPVTRFHGNSVSWLVTRVRPLKQSND